MRSALTTVICSEDLQGPLTLHPLQPQPKEHLAFGCSLHPQAFPTLLSHQPPLLCLALSLIPFLSTSTPTITLTPSHLPTPG
ncbi:hypothetical protein Pmani_007288 [Petrolisthes manimaculis]|uniref:Uncharacterized protein n=1 Tax=Petrolisthes manimaculis TaxID=1843537 RepID=A0AAE1QAW7_9EUCA|nr:hypothetical protein Pmani_007288 [Petrolisthes manimaculis]